MFSLLEKLDKNIDYIGQEYSYKLMCFIISAGYLFALVFGILRKDITYTLVLSIGTVVFCFFVTVPSWPYFRRHPLKFKKTKKE